MIRAMWTAATGMSAQELLINTMANNLANVNTTGFKKSRSNFEDIFYANIRDAGATTATGGTIPVGIQVGMGVRPTSVQKIFTQGDYVQTKNELDMAIEGNGFFQVMSDSGEIYTRDGNFNKDKDGYIVNTRGERLQPDFAIPSDTATVTIDKSGNITCLSSGGDSLATGQIPVYIFTNPAGLKAIGKNAFVSTPASGDAIQGIAGTDNFGTITQGYLEMSNVDAVDEMIQMIVGQRAYEMNSKTIHAADEMLQTVSNLPR
jgi:flagellar basal-body rod protein FlgG